MKNKVIRTLLLILVCMAVISAASLPALALEWDGSSVNGGSSTVSAGPNGYAIATDSRENCVGYRFSVVNKAGANKVSKVIDVFRDSHFGIHGYSGHKFNTKYNKKQLIGLQNGGFGTSGNTTNCYKEKDYAFATKLPDPSGMETWQNNTTNLNMVLSLLGAGNIKGLKNGDKILVEPLFDVRLEGVYHALTVTEIALYGKHILGAESDGGSSSTSESWGFISSFVNMHYPNSLFTPDGQGLWDGVSASASRIKFKNIINKGYGVGIAYTETKSDFSPALTVIKCEVWPGAKSARNNDHFGISTGNTFACWIYGHGYVKSGSRVWYSVNFPAETENCYVRQSVWVDGGASTSRNVLSNSNTWYDVALNPTTVPNNKSYITVKARVDWIESNGTVRKYGSEKSFYIPVRPTVFRDKVTAFAIDGTVQAYSGSGGSSGKMYFGQKVSFQYLYKGSNMWESSNSVRAVADRWNGSAWAHIYSGRTSGEDVYQDKVGLSAGKSYSKNTSIGNYVIPLPANGSANSNKLRFDLSTMWTSDAARTRESSTYCLPVVKSDVEIVDMKLVNSGNKYADRNHLQVGDKLTVHYFYRNNTDCTVFIKGYNDDLSQIPGIFAIPAGKTVEVAGASHTVPNQRAYTIRGSVYLDTVARGNTDYETDGDNNSATFICKSELPLSLTPIAPNAPYREGTSVVTCFYLRNNSVKDVIPSSDISVRMRVYKSGSSNAFTHLTKSVVVPAHNKNLVYFKWTVPEGLNGKDVTVKADIYDGKQYRDLVSNKRATVPYTYCTTPDTRYERKAPAGFKTPPIPTAKSASAQWEVFTYKDGVFARKKYAVSIKSGPTDAVAPSTGSAATKSGSKWVMKSGYGITLDSEAVMTNVSGYAEAGSDAYTLPQYAYAALPEYNYQFADGKCVTLEKTVGLNSRRHFILPENGEYGRTHFTPLWFPDGKYAVAVVQRDCWTPAGMIEGRYIPNPIVIKGSAYDDWYVGER